MVGQGRQKKLDQLIDEVSRGRRDLASIRDSKLRETVRLALRIHREAPAAPDAYTRLRMRARVLAGLEPRRRGLRDNAWTLLELLSRPAPYIVRGLAASSLVVTLAMSAVVASADTLPDDLLYPVKIATEEVRMALAVTPEDRAGVELSIADHRLREAESLATRGRTSDALVASAVYSQYIASAAAELAPVTTSDLAVQLEQQFATQRERAQTLATSLSTSPQSAAAAEILATIAKPTVAPGSNSVQRVADTAASVAARLVQVAEGAGGGSAAAGAASTPAATTTRQTETTARQTQTTSPQVTSPQTQTTSPQTQTSSSGTGAADATEPGSSSEPSAATTNTRRPAAESSTPKPARPAAESGGDKRQQGAADRQPADGGPGAGDGRGDGATRGGNTVTTDSGKHSEDVVRAVRKASDEARAAADRAKQRR